MTKLLKATIVIACLFAASCGMPQIVRRYDGPERSTDAIAILLNTENSSVRLVKLDGSTLVDWATTWDPDKWKELHIEPGRHSIYGNINTRYGYNNFEIEHEFQPGKTYRLAYVLSPDNTKFRVFVTEVSYSP